MRSLLERLVFLFTTFEVRRGTCKVTAKTRPSRVKYPMNCILLCDYIHVGIETTATGEDSASNKARDREA